jgi:membrane fusion protein, multidrug efflux system
MVEGRPVYAWQEEIEQLRDEVRRLKEQQEKQARDGKPDDEKKDGKKEEPKKGEASKDDSKQDDSKQDGKPKEPAKPHPVRNLIIVVAVIALVIAGVLWWLHARQFESTDDAIVDGHTSGLAARVSGTIQAVYVEENQFVKAGQVVVDLDPRDLQAALAQARGQLQQAQAQQQAEQPKIPSTRVTNLTNIATAGSSVTAAEAGVAAAERNYEAALQKVRESQATAAKAQADVDRYRPLAAKDEVPREQFDQIVANATAAAAALAANHATAQAAAKQVEQARAQVAQAQQRANEIAANAPRQVAIQQANVRSRAGSAQTSRAELDQALLNLSYAKITTPVSGIVSKRVAEIGLRVAPGQELIMVTQLDDLWVTANFRETQIRRMQAGQGVRIHVDALSQDFDGFVESMPAASGAVISLLPPENATGNFIKVVQRLPVRTRFKKNQNGLDRLRPGMSVEPKVKVR